MQLDFSLSWACRCWKVSLGTGKNSRFENSDWIGRRLASYCERDCSEWCYSRDTEMSYCRSCSRVSGLLKEIYYSPTAVELENILLL